MITPFVTRIAAFDPGACAESPHHPGRSPRPAFFVGIQPETCPPLTLGNARLERMRIIVIAPEQPLQWCGSESTDTTPASLAEVLPLLPPGWHRLPITQLRPRLVLGEILRGENGALYERVGQQIRPLRQLVASPNGEVLDIPQSNHDSPRLRALLAAPVEPEDLETRSPARPRCGPDPEVDSPSTSPTQSTQTREASRVDTPMGNLGFHPLFPEPGQWRVVRLADFQPMLLPQLAHPERLRSAHRLPCYVQVFTVTAPMKLEHLAQAIFDDASATAELGILTPTMVHRLQLGPWLAAPPPAQRPRPAGLLLPGDQVFSLELANDPTSDRPSAHGLRQPAPAPSVNAPNPVDGPLGSTSPPNEPLPASPGTQGSGPTAFENPRPTAAGPGIPPRSAAASTRVPNLDPPAPAFHAPPLTAPAVSLKTGIPSQSVKPCEFRRSREEVLLELVASRSWSGRFRAGLRRWFSTRAFNRALRTWQVQLAGKSPEEQLWSVRPPDDALDHPFVREWAERTLEAAGYDARLMRFEWEMFWRRKTA